MAFLMIASLLSACECDVKSAEQLIEEADIIFRGELSNVSENIEGCNETGTWNNAFLVLEVYKGTVAERINIQSPPPDKDPCGMVPDRGREMMVYAVNIPGFREYESNLCAGTKIIEDADPDLALLGDGVPPEGVGCGALPAVRGLWAALFFAWFVSHRRRLRRVQASPLARSPSVAVR